MACADWGGKGGYTPAHPKPVNAAHKPIPGFRPPDPTRFPEQSTCLSHSLELKLKAGFVAFPRGRLSPGRGDGGGLETASWVCDASLALRSPNPPPTVAFALLRRQVRNIPWCVCVSVCVCVCVCVCIHICKETSPRSVTPPIHWHPQPTETPPPPSRTRPAARAWKNIERCCKFLLADAAGWPNPPPPHLTPPTVPSPFHPLHRPLTPERVWSAA
jgi:hypothetical protein